MTEAQAGEVLVSEMVEVLCRSSGLKLEDAGEHELKGVPDPVRLYRLSIA
jgi:class 3 adenylate cyclase